MSGFNLRSKNNAIHGSVEKNTPRHELKVAIPDNACKKPQLLQVATNIWKKSNNCHPFYRGYVKH